MHHGKYSLGLGEYIPQATLVKREKIEDKANASK
jgi:hypothetical protein